MNGASWRGELPAFARSFGAASHEPASQSSFLTERGCVHRTNAAPLGVPGIADLLRLVLRTQPRSEPVQSGPCRSQIIAQRIHLDLHRVERAQGGREQGSR